MQNILDFFKQNEVAITDFCLNAGYVLIMISISFFILFFFCFYMKRRHGFNLKASLDYLYKEVFDFFTMTVFVYFSFISGVMTGLSESACIFEVMPVWVYSLLVIPLFFLGIFSGFIVIDTIGFLIKRRRPHDDSESNNLCNISNDSSVTHDNHPAIFDD